MEAAEANGHESSDEGWEDAEPEPQEGTTVVLDLSLTKATRKRKRNTLSKEERAHLVLTHKAELLLLLARAMQVAEWSFSEDVCAMMLSLLPGHMLSRVHKYLVDDLAWWMRSNFRCVEDSALTEDEGQHGSDPTSLARGISNRVVSANMLTQLFLALGVALGLCARYTCTLDPEKCAGTLGQTRKQKVPDSIAESAIQDIRHVPEREPLDLHRAWAEVFLKVDDGWKWVPVDVWREQIDKPELVEQNRPRGRKVAYVVSIDTDFAVRDVTQRYASRWSKSLELRLPVKEAVWWDGITNGIQQHTTCSGPSVSSLPQDSDNPGQNRDALDESEELRNHALNEPMPTTLDGFKNHPVYVIDQCIGKFESIYPKQAVAVVKGRQVFLREHELRTANQWRKRGRVVLQEQLDTPVKTAERKSTTFKLFGEWQTIPYEVPSVQNGIIPVNEHGSVEVWDGDERHIPQGAAYVPYTGAKKVAERLGIHYAEAITGFETKNDRRVPVIKGIVVLEDMKDVVMTACEEIEIASQEHAIQKRSARAVKNWKRIVSGVIRRLKLREEYGH